MRGPDISTWPSGIYKGDVPSSDDVHARAAQLLERRVLNAWARLYDSEDGRALIWDLLDRCGLHSVTHTGNSNSAFLEGQRNVALTVLKEFLLPLDPGALGTLMAEAQTRYDHLSAVATAELEQGELTNG